MISSPVVSEQSVASKVETIDPLADPRWDRFVEAHPFGLVCHLSGWKRVLEESFSHMKGHCLTLANGDGSIRAALPVFEIRSLFFGNRLVSIPFATNCDPLISSSEDMTALLDAAINLSIELHCPKIEIRTLSSYPVIRDDKIGNVVLNKSHQLSLESTLDDIMKAFSKKIRQKIRKPLQGATEIQLAGNETHLAEFYRHYVKTRKRLGLPPQPYLFFESIWRNLWPSKHVALLLVRNEGKLVAGMMMFTFKGRCSCEYLGTDLGFKEVNANLDVFIYWEAIKWAHLQGYRIFDFGRTGITNEGLMFFKSLWGTKVVDLPQFYYPKRICSGLDSREESFSYNFIRKVAKNLPDPMFQWLGNMLYMHLG